MAIHPVGGSNGGSNDNGKNMYTTKANEKVWVRRAHTIKQQTANSKQQTANSKQQWTRCLTTGNELHPLGNETAGTPVA